MGKLFCIIYFETLCVREVQASLVFYTSSFLGCTYFFLYLSNNISQVGGSPGLVVMGGGSRSKSRGFESRRRILDGHDIFSH